jgi:hypothetical protein
MHIWERSGKRERRKEKGEEETRMNTKKKRMVI